MENIFKSHYEIIESFSSTYDKATDLLVEYELNKRDKDIEQHLKMYIKWIEYMIDHSRKMNVPLYVINNMIRGGNIIKEYIYLY